MECAKANETCGNCLFILTASEMPYMGSNVSEASPKLFGVLFLERDDNTSHVTVPTVGHCDLAEKFHRKFVADRL